MRAILVGVAAASLLSITASTARAQDDGDFAAWYAMMFTPYGALPSLVTPGMAGMPIEPNVAGTFDVKYGRWQFDETGERFNNYGVGGRSGRTGYTVGYATCERCPNGVIMGQVDFERALVTSSPGTDGSGSSLFIGIRPSFGFGKPTRGHRTLIAANLDAPASVSMRVGQRSRVVPFIAPGVGAGLDRGRESDMGVRTALAAGVGVFPSERFAIHAVWRKIFIEDGPGSLGLGLSFRRVRRV